MEFLKKHYEKILLSVVLLGLAVAAAWLPIKVSSVREALQAATTGYIGATPKPIKLPEIEGYQTVLTRVRRPQKPTFAKAGHNVFNPIQWKTRVSDGTPVPITDEGLRSLMVTNIISLYTRIEYQGASVSGETVRYQFQVTREASTNASWQRPILRMAAVGAKNEIFTLREIKGPKEDPTELVLDVVETRSTVSVAKGTPFAQVAGFAADMRYEPESKSYLRQRAGQKLTLAGVSYNIVAISQGDVTLEDSQTKKRTTILWSGAR